MTEAAFVSTSIARRLIARMQATHERRRISVFAGPPGIGKTTAVDEFVRRRPGEVAVVKVARRNAREVLVLQHVLEAVRRLTGSSFEHAPSSLWDLRNDLFGALCHWAGVEPSPARRGEYDTQAFAPLTIVFDEAQNLSREAIDGLRYWNDPDRCYAPFPVALVFVGNNEFSLGGATAAEITLSDAVADRALYLQTFDYDDVTDDDLALFIETQRDLEPSALTAIVRSFKTPRAQRSLRRVSDLLDDLDEIAGGAAVTAETVRQALELA
jgi:RecA/RadA recombinase